jgi:hypothetical protein
MAEEFIAFLQKRDEEFLRDVMKRFKQQVDDTVTKIQDHDTATITEWRDKIREKISLVIARRLLRLEMITESRIGEVILAIRDGDGDAEVSPKTPEQIEEAKNEARRRASDVEKLQAIFEADISEFIMSGENQIEKLLETVSDQDRTFGLNLVIADQKFVTGLKTRLLLGDPSFTIGERERLIASRDQMRGDKVEAKYRKRQVLLTSLYKETVKINATVLEKIDEVSLDDVDATSLEGRSLEDYCFDD